MLIEGVELVVEASDRRDFIFESFVRLNDIHIVAVLDLLLDNHF